MLPRDAKRPSGDDPTAALNITGGDGAHGNTDLAPVADATMTKGDRDQLAGIVKMRARVAKSAVGQREAELTADFEQQLATRFDQRATHWAEATAVAEAAVADADRFVAERCAELGIPEEFRPSCRFWWQSRGENAEPTLRAELRKVAVARIAAIGKLAKHQIEQRQADALTALVAHTLDTSTGRAWLESIPSAEELMPVLALAELETEVPATRRLPWD